MYWVKIRPKEIYRLRIKPDQSTLKQSDSIQSMHIKRCGSVFIFLDRLKHFDLTNTTVYDRIRPCTPLGKKKKTFEKLLPQWLL